MSDSVSKLIVARVCTLFFLTEGDRVLLGLKKRGFGTGKLNGFGGKVEPGETLLIAALRELEEESGVTVDAASKGINYCAYLRFNFASSPVPLDVHVFQAPFPPNAITTESDEMAPEWHEIDKLPLANMWLDDAHWLPLVLAGHTLRASFDFDGLTNITRTDVNILPKGGSPCSFVEDAASVQLVPLGALPQESINYT